MGRGNSARRLVPARLRSKLGARRRRILGTYLANASPVTPKTKICILATGRTGTELLVELLDDHPDIRCESEILRPLTFSALRFVRGRAKIARLRGFHAYGFKAVSNQFHSIRPRGRVDLFLRKLHSDGFAFVHLARRNILRQAISHIRAEQMDDYHPRGDGRDRLVLTVDIPDLFWKMAWIEKNEEQLTAWLGDIPHVHLYYEDALERPEDRQRTLHDLQRMLGVEPRDTATDLRKVGAATLADDVTNLDEITQLLGQTRFAVYLPQ
jgi:LPS sulfotransferase NodH